MVPPGQFTERERERKVQPLPVSVSARHLVTDALDPALHLSPAPSLCSACVLMTNHQAAASNCAEESSQASGIAAVQLACMALSSQRNAAAAHSEP